MFSETQSHPVDIEFMSYTNVLHFHGENAAKADAQCRMAYYGKYLNIPKYSTHI